MVPYTWTWIPNKGQRWPIPFYGFKSNVLCQSSLRIGLQIYHFSECGSFVIDLFCLKTPTQSTWNIIQNLSLMFRFTLNPSFISYQLHLPDILSLNWRSIYHQKCNFQQYLLFSLYLNNKKWINWLKFIVRFYFCSLFGKFYFLGLACSRMVKT